MFFALALMAATANAAKPAGVTQDIVSSAKNALSEGDAERALSLLAQARMSLPNEPNIVNAATVAEILYLEGLAPRVLGADREHDIDKFRDALSVFPEFQWNRQILDDKGLRGYFEALRAEVLQRAPVHTQVPKKRGLLKTYVDGVEHQSLNAVRSGPHLAQVECPDGQVAGQWTDFEGNMDWIGLCKVRPDLKAKPSQTETDEFAFEMPDPNAGPEPMRWIPPRKVKQPFTVSKKTWYISAGIAGAVAIGTYAAALSARSTYDDLDNPDLRNPADLEAQRSKTNTLVGISIGSAVVGGGLAAAGMFTGSF
jgi:hypothetical protein